MNWVQVFVKLYIWKKCLYIFNFLVLEICMWSRILECHIDECVY